MHEWIGCDARTCTILLFAGSFRYRCSEHFTRTRECTHKHFSSHDNIYLQAFARVKALLYGLFRTYLYIKASNISFLTFTKTIFFNEKFLSETTQKYKIYNITITINVPFTVKDKYDHKFKIDFIKLRPCIYVYTNVKNNHLLRCTILRLNNYYTQSACKKKIVFAYSILFCGIKYITLASQGSATCGSRAASGSRAFNLQWLLKTLIKI